VSVLIIVVLGTILLGQIGNNNVSLLSNPTRTLTVDEYVKLLDNKGVETASWEEKQIHGRLKDSKENYVVNVVPASEDKWLQERIVKSGATFKIDPTPLLSVIGQFLIMILLPAATIGILLWIMYNRQAQASGNQALNFGRSRAKRAGENTPKVTFEDVAGVDEAKEELFEVVDFLRNTKKYVALGAKIPKGILLTGPPGVGKTHLARAIAGEAGVPFFHISGSDFVEMFVGVGAARVRDLFETAKAHRPCLIFVDEIDAVGRQRGAGLGGGHDEREQTLNQLLVEMDGFDPNMGVIMIAATNRPDVLDPALLRPGRFDRQIVVDAPDARGREAILKVHSKGKPFEHQVDMSVIARRTPGFTGADLSNALNESALLAARRNKLRIGVSEIEEALDRVMMGPARKSRVMKKEELLITAYHEAGHAIIGELLDDTDPIHKVTILPRGMALGLTWSLPNEDTSHTSRSELLDDITMSLGGLVAEETVYGERFTGASSDLERVTRIARAMVMQFGMSERLGSLAIGRRSRNPFLGRDVQEDRDYSEEVAKQIDEEVRSIVEECHRRATDILTTQREKLDAIAQALMEHETLDREQFLAVMEGRPIPGLEAQSNQVETLAEAEAVPDSEQKGLKPPSRLEPGPA
jgi:cell division protease FtsH